MPHVLGTEQEAVRLARRYGGDEIQARIAALLHDCTKKLDMPEQLALCAQYGIGLDELEQEPAPEAAAQQDRRRHCPRRVRRGGRGVRRHLVVTPPASRT